MVVTGFACHDHFSSPQITVEKGLAMPRKVASMNMMNQVDFNEYRQRAIANFNGRTNYNSNFHHLAQCLVELAGLRRKKFSMLQRIRV
jgi:hypothetical protein